MKRDEQMLDFATPRQAEVLRAIWDNGGVRAAAREMGIDHSAVIKASKAVRAKAARGGYAPEHGMTKTVPDGFHLKGTSTLYKDGEPVVQWVKTSIDHERQAEIMREAIKGMADEIPKAAPVPFVGGPLDADLLNCYVITDFHLGALSWKPETGADWNMDIAERTLVLSLIHI